MCDKCGGKGSYGENLQPSGRVVDLGDGYTMHNEGGYITHLCECRASLPRRHGKAGWWSSETAHSESMTTLDGLGEVHCTITRELPISEDNYPLHRTRDNCWYSVTPSIEIEMGPAATAESMREVAAFLVRMAAKCDELDVPYPDPT